ncbi:MAG: DUF4838 domain-containing protein, partial [Victivallaceae bacterium]|nr:DUF4838 domain-containing protein [Victivallaceae bacterium]
RASLYAVYTFLRDVMGTRWLWPGPDGEFVLRNVEFILNDISINHVSGFKYRGFHLIRNKNDLEAQKWMSRNCLNVMRSDRQNSNNLNKRKSEGFYILYSAHDAKLDKKYFSKYPEYFAEINGRRIPDQVCWNNPEAEQLIVNKLIEWCRLHPETEIVSLFPADNMVYCQCEKCRKYDLSTCWFNFYKRIVSGVRNEYPKLKFWGLAYQGYSGIPSTDLTNSGIELVEYCALERCGSHLRCGINERSLKAISKWQQKGISLGAYCYVFDFFRPYAYIANQKNIDEMVKKYHSMGLASVIPEVITNVSTNTPKEEQFWYCNRLPIYVYARLLWNPNLKLDDIIKDFCVNAYGPATDTMLKYHSLMQSLWNAQDGHVASFFVSPTPVAEKIFKNDSQMAQLKKTLTTAKTQINGLKDIEKQKNFIKNIALDEKIFHRWIEMYNKYQITKTQNIINVSFSSDQSFKDATKLPTFKNTKGKLPSTDTMVYFDNDALYIKCICYDNNIEKLNSKYKKHDQHIWADECLEIFIKNPSDTVGSYKHLVVNSGNVKYDAVAHDETSHDVNWNPHWETSVKINKDNWTVSIKLPFEALGGAPKNGDTWGFSIKRSVGQRKDIANSGFPDASYHSMDSFGVLYFSREKIDNNLSFVMPTKYKEKHHETMLNLKTKLARSGWGANIIYKDDNFDDSLLNANVICIKSPVSETLVKYCRKKIIPEIKKGKMLIYSIDAKSRLDEITGDPSFALRWSGYDYDSARKTVFVAPGAWSNKPGNLLKRIERRPTPLSGYTPVSAEGWHVLASFEAKTGEKVPYLLMKKLDKGVVIATSLNMGLRGGYEFCGNKDIDSIPMLIDNLWHVHNLK